MILTWREDDSSSVFTSAEFPNYLDLVKLGLKCRVCVPLPRPFPLSVVRIDGNDEPTDFFYAGPLPVVSIALKNILEGHQVNAEFEKIVAVQNNNQIQNKHFYICNVLDEILLLQITSIVISLVNR